MAVLKSPKLDAALERLKSKLGQPMVLRVGWFPDDKYPDGTLVAMVAIMQEYGTKTIPPRPFMRKMIAEKQDSWGNQVLARLKHNDWDAQKTLEDLAEFVIKPQLQQSIISVNSPPLSPITLMLRYMNHVEHKDITGASLGEAARRVAAREVPTGISTKPLEDTKTMLKTVRSEVTTS